MDAGGSGDGAWRPGRRFEDREAPDAAAEDDLLPGSHLEPDRTPAMLPPPAPARPRSQQLKRRLLLVSALRVLMQIVLGAATALYGGDPAHPFLDTVRVSLLWAAGLSLIPAVAYLPLVQVTNSPKLLRILAQAMIAQDCLFAAVIVIVTGGTGSAFTFFFSLTIIIAGTLIGRMGTLESAVLSTLLLLGIAALETGAVAPPSVLGDALVPVSSESVAYSITINLVAFASIAFLSSYLSEALRRSDIQRERYRTNLEDLRQLHESILVSIESGILTCRLDHRVLHMNRAAEALLGLDFRSAKGRNLVDVLPEARLPLAAGERRFEFTRLGRETGRARTLQASFTPLLSRSGEMIGRIVVVDDVSPIKEMEARQKADERLTTIGKLSAVVAHEIRNPLATISASAQMLNMAVGIGDQDRRVAEIVVREADRLNLWITELLDYARPKKGEPLAVDVSGLLAECLEVLRRDPAAALVEVASDVAPGVRVQGDLQRLLRVFLNLGKNALEAMPDGGRLRIALWTETREGRRWAALSFADNGHGIAKEDLPRVFDAFFTTKPRGTGLGLATVAQVVEEHGGTVEVDSVPGVRTEFTIRLPAMDG